MTIRRGYLETPRGPLHYAESGSGQPIVLLHQAPRSIDEFAELLPVLGRDRRAIAMDLPGFGQSRPLPAPQTIEEMARGVLDLLDALSLPRAVVLGHHTGAVVAAEVAIQAPERVTHLVLSSMPWVDAERRSRTEPIGVDNAVPASDGSHLLELWRQRLPYYPTGRSDLLDRFIRDALAPGIDPQEGHRACGRYEMDQRIGAISGPVLLLRPLEDPFIQDAFPRVLAGLVNADVRVIDIPDAGVVTMEIAAEAVAEAVADFLGDRLSR